MVKDLSALNNLIIDVMRINTILNSLPSSYKMTMIALKTQFDNLNIDQLPLQLKSLEDDIKADKKHELMMVRDKPSGNYFIAHPKPLKRKFNNKFRKNT